VIVGPRLVTPAGRIAETGHRFPSLKDDVIELLFGARIAKTRNVFNVDDAQAVIQCEWISGVLIVGRTNTFRALGGFDPRYFMYVEDIDLFTRLNERGGKCLWQGLATVTHYGAVREDTRGAISGELFGLAIYNRSVYRRKVARSVPSVQALLVIASGAVGAFWRSAFWLLRCYLARRPGRKKSLEVQAQKALGMSAMFVKAGGIALAALFGRVPPLATTHTKVSK
jgi:GT2 family glycosyltransferase